MPRGNANRPTGIPARMGRVIPRTLGKDTLAQLAKKASTTASPSSARKFTRTTLTSTPLGKSPRDAPERPKVDVGPKAYSTYRSGARGVIRFYVVKKRGRWYVMDMCAERDCAAKTAKDGYATKKEAVDVARYYRDEYGAYAKAPF